MHEPVKGRLEEYLRAGRAADGFAAVDEHLQQCRECRSEVELMRAQNDLFRALRAPASLELGAGFYARVMNRVEAEAKPSAWSLFGESLFAKRLVYASATFLILLGTVLVSSTGSEFDDFAMDSSPEAVLAGQQDPEPVNMVDQQKDRDVILVNLATYQQDYQ